MNRHQKETLAVILLVLCGMIFFKIDIPMMAMAGAAILLILGVMEDKKAVAAVNWNTLLLSLIHIWDQQTGAVQEAEYEGLM